MFDKQKQKLTRQDRQAVVQRRAEVEIVRRQILKLRHRVLDPSWTHHPAYRITTISYPESSENREERKLRSLYRKKADEEGPLAFAPLQIKVAQEYTMENTSENLLWLARNETVWKMKPYDPEKRPRLRIKTVSKKAMRAAFILERDGLFRGIRDKQLAAAFTLERERLFHGMRDNQLADSPARSPLATSPTAPTPSARDSGYDGSLFLSNSPTMIKTDPSSTMHSTASSTLHFATVSRLNATKPHINYANGKHDKNLDDVINELQDKLRMLVNAEVETFQSVAVEEAESSPPDCDEYHAFLRDSVTNNIVAKHDFLTSEEYLNELKAAISEMEERMISIHESYYESSLNEQVKAGLIEGINRRPSIPMSTISEHDTEAALYVPHDCSHPCCKNSNRWTLISRTGAVFEEEHIIPHQLGRFDDPFATPLKHKRAYPGTNSTAQSSVKSSGSQKALPALPKMETDTSETPSLTAEGSRARVGRVTQTGWKKIWVKKSR